MEKEFIQLPPLPMDIDGDVIKVVWEYLRLSKEEQEKVFADLQDMIGEPSESMKYPENSRRIEIAEITDYVESIRQLTRRIILEASDIASWVFVRKYMEGKTLEQMIEEMPHAKDFIFIMDTLLDKNIGIVNESGEEVDTKYEDNN